jgi:hypothetical protein
VSDCFAIADQHHDLVPVLNPRIITHNPTTIWTGSKGIAISPITGNPSSNINVTPVN